MCGVSCTWEIEAQGWDVTELTQPVGQEATPHLSWSCLLGPVWLEPHFQLKMGIGEGSSAAGLGGRTISRLDGFPKFRTSGRKVSNWGLEMPTSVMAFSGPPTLVPDLFSSFFRPVPVRFSSGLALLPGRLSPRGCRPTSSQLWVLQKGGNWVLLTPVEVPGFAPIGLLCITWPAGTQSVAKWALLIGQAVSDAGPTHRAGEGLNRGVGSQRKDGCWAGRDVSAHHRGLGVKITLPHLSACAKGTSKVQGDYLCIM